MYKSYNIKNNITAIQNLLINESIKDTSNIQLLKSEEAVKDVLKSYSEKFNAIGGKLTDFKKHYAQSKSIIQTKQFNELFDGLYIDLKTLYEELSYVENILDINLERNKKFFNILKKRMRELWDKLYITRLNINDTSVFHESYFESFSTIYSNHRYSNIILDKKTGYIKLNPKKYVSQNKRYLIKKITSKTFPVHNSEGGVLHTTNTLNEYQYNYTDGTRDMLENGLWKEQLFCNDIPEITYNITENTSSPLYKSVNGIMSFIDIEYNYPVEINNIDIDVFGDNAITVLGIFIKNQSSDNWLPIHKLDYILYDSNYYDWVDNFKPISNFDIISITNIELFKAKFLRFVLSQENYTMMDSSNLITDLLSDKINNDFAERRYEIVKLDGGSDDRPAIYRSSQNDSLYSEITNIIENTRSIEETLQNILDILEPPIKLKNVNFNKTLKYEIGAWSIEPTLKKYQGTGKFDSDGYIIRDKSLINISLKTKQEDIKHNTCNWYISHPDYNINIPILENNNKIRKEPANIIRPDYYKDKGWNTGYFIQLDFPFDLTTIAFIKIYMNGNLINLSDLTYYVLNSTLIYIENVQDVFKNKYVIQYMPAIYESVNVYIMDKTKAYTSNDPSEYLVITPRSSLLNYFIHQNNKSETYRVKKSICTKMEFDLFFPNNTNLCISSDVNTSYMPNTSQFKKNVVNNFRSVDYNIYTAGDLSTNIYGSQTTPAIPIRIDRSI